MKAMLEAMMVAASTHLSRMRSVVVLPAVVVIASVPG
jgi:hypothetical protein